MSSYQNVAFAQTLIFKVKHVAIIKNTNIQSKFASIEPKWIGFTIVLRVTFKLELVLRNVKQT